MATFICKNGEGLGLPSEWTPGVVARWVRAFIIRCLVASPPSTAQLLFLRPRLHYSERALPRPPFGVFFEHGGEGDGRAPRAPRRFRSSPTSVHVVHSPMDVPREEEGRRGEEGEGKKSFVCTTLAREINGPLTRTETANSGPGGLFKKERKKRGRGKERKKETKERRKWGNKKEGRRGCRKEN